MSSINKPFYEQFYDFDRFFGESLETLYRPNPISSDAGRYTYTTQPATSTSYGRSSASATTSKGAVTTKAGHFPFSSVSFPALPNTSRSRSCPSIHRLLLPK
ncbi:hypothetical protein AX16_010346 [Volvariella volvacea WC 439]|nr:hypothetical protein AX16_010346 [Volvariella volvacea WC 439]